jgi:hypothetical protein
MQSYQGHSLASASRDNRRHHNLSSSESGSNRHLMRHDEKYDNNRRQGSHDDSDRRSTLTSSRWVPPSQGKHCLPPSPADNIFGCNRLGENHKRCATKHGEGGEGGPKGGGKVIKQRHHSSSVPHDRNNQYQNRRPQQRMKLVTPDVKELTSSHQQQCSIDVFMTTAPTTSATTTTNVDIPKMNPADPAHAKRIHQRRRQVLFGKNTAGYEEYVKKVPKHKRKHRSLDCPMTPDHMLDIPTKRWQGLMNAW